MSTLLQDAFTDADLTRLNAHTMNVGSGWTEHVGTWTILSNKARELTTQFATASADAGAADVVITVDVDVPNTTGYALGIVARVVNGTNAWWCLVQRDSGGTPYLVILEENAGTPTVRAGGSGVTDVGAVSGTTITLTVTCSGNSITLASSGAGANSCSYTSATFQNTATRHGLFDDTLAGYTGGTFDNFLVVSNSGAVTFPELERLIRGLNRGLTQ